MLATINIRLHYRDLWLRRAGVDDQLPSVTEAEYGAGEYPGCDNSNRKNEHSRTTAEVRRRLRKSGIPRSITHNRPFAGL